MTKEHDEQLKLVTNMLNNMTNEEFLDSYNRCERHIGPTVEEYLNSNCNIDIVERLLWKDFVCTTLQGYAFNDKALATTTTNANVIVEKYREFFNK
jgi:hypothetical protein